MVDLGEPQTIVSAGASFLQDVRSWIWMPAEVVVEVSTDGEVYRRVARLENAIGTDDYELRTLDWVAACPAACKASTSARCVASSASARSRRMPKAALNRRG